MAAWSRLAPRRQLAARARRGRHARARLTKAVADTLAPYDASDDEPRPARGPRSPTPRTPASPTACATWPGCSPSRSASGSRRSRRRGEFDTHDDQPEDLAKALAEVCAALAAFQADLEARGLADRVLTFVWSEFGRRPRGERVRRHRPRRGRHRLGAGHARAAAAMLTEYPDLRRLDRDGNLEVTVDFRRVYCSLLEQWLGTDAGEVIPNAGAFGRLGLVA